MQVKLRFSLGFDFLIRLQRKKKKKKKTKQEEYFIKNTKQANHYNIVENVSIYIFIA